MFARKHRISAFSFIDRSIEIVAPYIADKERLELRARFRSVESARQFYLLEDDLRNLAKQHPVRKLPDFTSIR